MYYAYQINVYGLANKPEGFNFPHIKDYWRVLVGAVVFIILEEIIQAALFPLFKNVAKDQSDESMRTKYAKKAASCAFKTLYFTGATAWGYIVLKETNWLSWWMGGPPDGSFENVNKNLPFNPFPPAVLDYSLFTAGYHFGGLAKSLFLERRHDFEEMLLHHIATCALFFGFVLANFMGVGSSIAFLHDIADITSSLVKCTGCTYFDKLSNVLFLVHMLVWFVTRLIWLPYYIWMIWTTMYAHIPD